MGDVNDENNGYESDGSGDDQREGSQQRTFVNTDSAILVSNQKVLCLSSNQHL
jgi:hypothetical protein